SEIAQEVALEAGVTIWVDGSLWNHDYYKERFKRIRKSYPQYRIAIVSITAEESIVQKRLADRAVETGRQIPPLRARTAARALERLPELTGLVDFHARITNDLEPVLEYVEMHNSQGDWDLIQRLF
ncbi:unnamed protein product, partial [Amoebophrya sp. A25]